MELRLQELETSPVTNALPRRLRAAGSREVRPFRFVFVTFATEIDGEAPLIALMEAIDD